MKTEANNFFDSLKDNPKEIIAWAKREIAEYQKLIRLVEKEMAKKKKK